MAFRAIQTLLGTAVLAGCCTSCSSNQPAAPAARMAPGTAGVTALAVGNGRNPPMTGYFATFERNDGQWSVLDISTTRPKLRDPGRQELLVFSDDLSSVQPDYRVFPEHADGGTFPCGRGLLAKPLKDYNPCQSVLTSAPSVLRNVVGMAFVWPILATGSVVGTFAVDKEKVSALVAQTGVLERIRMIKQNEARATELVRYRSIFKVGRKAIEFDDFVRKYSGNDPENLIPMAIVRRDELLVSEAKERKQQKIEDARRDAAERKAAAERREEEVAQRRVMAEQKRRHIAEMAQFRQTIKTETQTNCGPVVEVKATLAKVYFPVANYGNEHWIKKDQLFPPGYSCNFFNGGYLPPSFEQ